MSPENRFTFIRRTSAEDGTGQRLRAAQLKTRGLLNMWRGRFTDTDITKQYPMEDLGTAKLTSTSPDAVQVELTMEDGMTRYAYDLTSEEITRTDFDDKGTEMEATGEPLEWHDDLSYVLFLCDRQELRG